MSLHNKINSRLLKEKMQAASEKRVTVSFYKYHRISSTADFRNEVYEKLEQLAKREIDHVVVVPFDTNFAEQSPEIYIQDFLVGIFKPHSIIIGYDHKFGKNRAGDIFTLDNSELIPVIA